ncbi:hypothetical protein CTheo_6392 [Ceratobasidium theobromae]|uniref:Uncharacterized protein n=1 Tax=Ceratobasidium theobromae TaxID=1582974 RepID=A0A5N5QET0_9AGAM|nr:hypothetical protein CTheo_6392 [Ceratobasidium theobromae]
MDSPLAYYTTAAALQADQRDLATTIRQLSNDTIKLDEQFQAVYSDIKSQEMFDTSPTAPSNQWAETRKIYTNLMWSARHSATKLKTHTTALELLDVVIRAVADATQAKAAKIDALKNFIEAPVPSLLTAEYATEQVGELKKQLGAFNDKYSAELNEKIAAARAEITQLEEKDKEQKLKNKNAGGSGGLCGCLRRKPPPADSVDYEGQIKKLQTSISNWEKLRGDVEGGVHEISAKLDSIPDRVGNTFLTLWSHEKGDAEHLKQAVESSSTGTVEDISIAEDAYKQVNEALHYFETNVNQTGS